MVIKGKEIIKDVVMVLDKLFGKMDQVTKVSGMRMLVMVMEYSEQKQVKNIVANGKMMYVTAKVSGLMQMEEKYLEILEMINVKVYVLINLKEKKIIN